MTLLKEFRDFAVKGNVVDMAVGIIIGAAFTSIVNSLVKDVIMPPLGMAMGNVDFKDKKVLLGMGADGKTEVFLSYGLFINAIISFLIVAFVLFLVVKAINKAKRKEAVAPTSPPVPTPTEKLLAEIRDELRARR